MTVKRAAAALLCITLLLCLPVCDPAGAQSGPLPEKKKQELSYETVRNQFNEAIHAIRKEKDSIAARRKLPCVYIVTQDRQPVLSKDEYVPAVIDVFNCGEEELLTAPGGVKVRGNSTADQGDEKPYRIKFEKKQNMLGLHDGAKYKSWVLLRSYWNLLADYTGFNLARTIFDGQYYSSDCSFVHVYLNGEYRGLYLLCEQNQAAKGRVDVRQPEPGDTRLETGYLVELDNYPSDEHPFFTLDHENATVADIAGEVRKMAPAQYSVKSDVNTYEQVDFIHRYIEGAFRILFEACLHDKPMKFDSAYQVVPADGISPADAVSAVMDPDSLASMLILEELVHNNDVGEGSFYMAVDFSEDSRYPRLTFLAPWDFNWAYEGKADGGYYASTFQPVNMNSDRSNVWFITAMKADWFRAVVREKWDVLSRSGVLQETTARIEATRRSLESELDGDFWRLNAAEELLAFVNGRIAWLGGCGWEPVEQPEQITITARPLSSP